MLRIYESIRIIRMQLGSFGSVKKTFCMVHVTIEAIVAYYLASLKIVSDSREAQSLEAQAVERMLAGDEGAFAELYERYFDKIYGFIYKRVGHREVAEDLTSTVFERAFVKRESFGARGNYFGGWLYTIATNAITDHWRTKKPQESLEVAETIASSGKSPSEITEGLLTANEMQNVLEQLPERERLCVTLKFYEGYENGEIAALLGITPNHAGVLIHRAVKRCGQVMSKQ
ncbi:MAG: sigma-70 family RNA polymerase sigma factor [bacterium]|nr:sigma-70 family RNA polymerase sigma factor [bacterium]